MPFINKEEFARKAGLSSTRSLIAGLPDEEFSDLELQAAQIITAKTSFPSPASVEDSPEWAKMPAVLLMTYFYASGADSISDVQLSSMNSDYKKAMEILELHNDTNGVVSSVTIVQIEGI